MAEFRRKFLTADNFEDVEDIDLSTIKQEIPPETEVEGIQITDGLWSLDNVDQKRHCLICNSPRVDELYINNPKVMTSCHSLLVEVLTDIVEISLDVNDVHSNVVCRKCFTLLDELDEVEHQLLNMKQTVKDKYNVTLQKVEVERQRLEETTKIIDATPLVPSARVASVKFEREKSSLGNAPPKRKRGRPKKGAGVPIKRSTHRKVEYDSDEDDFVCALGDDDDDDVDYPFEEDILGILGPSSPKDEDFYLAKRRRGRPPGSGKKQQASKKISRELSRVVVEASIDDEDLTGMLKRITVKKERADEGEQDEENENQWVTLHLDDEARLTNVQNSREFVEAKLVTRRLHRRPKKQIHQCSFCPKRYLSAMLLEEHSNIHTGATPFKCDYCDVHFSLRRMLRKHTRKSHKGQECRAYKCDQCDRAFPFYQQLQTHSANHDGRKDFVCTICGVGVCTKKTLETHMMLHTGEKPFACEFCGALFRQKGNMIAHVRLTHLQLREHNCPDCGRSFKRRRLLAYHMMSVHTGERPHKCDLCGAAFVIPQHYKKHMLTHTGVKPHKCGVCDKAFTSKENRNTHQYTHSAVKPYECRLCGCGFMRKPQVLLHVKQHGIEQEPLDDFYTYNPRADVDSLTLMDGDSKGNLVANYNPFGGKGRPVRLVPHARAGSRGEGAEEQVRFLVIDNLDGDTMEVREGNLNDFGEEEVYETVSGID